MNIPQAAEMLKKLKLTHILPQDALAILGAAVPAEPVAWIEQYQGAIAYNPYKHAALKLPDGVRFDLYAAPQATPPAPGWVCPKCGTDRLKAACPQGHSAALTGQCPMVGTAASAPPAAPADHVRMPTSEAEAELMAKLGYHWLRVHAPHKLTKPEAPPAAADAPVCPWCDREGWDTCQHADEAKTCHQ